MYAIVDYTNGTLLHDEDGRVILFRTKALAESHQLNTDDMICWSDVIRVPEVQFLAQADNEERWTIHDEEDVKPLHF